MASSNAYNKGNDYEEGTTMQLLENGIDDTNTHKNAASQLCNNQPHQRSGYFSGTTNPAIRLQDSLWQISDSIGFRFRLYNPKSSEFEVEQNSNSVRRLEGLAFSTGSGTTQKFTASGVNSNCVEMITELEDMLEV
ncbi:unnamed protein product [Mucor circinelloides]|nr:hypothetical protein G6F42_022794 [Rhizopus arrhizus]